MTPISAVGLELWSMTSDIYFDNFIICSEKEVADRWAADGWGLKKLVASANEVSILLYSWWPEVARKEFCWNNFL